MNNFEFQNPTKILFGKNQISNLSKEIPKNAKILLLYGGGSIKENGIFDQVKKSLSKFKVYEFGGILSNPEYDILLKALKLIKTQKITFLIAVGGGSVIDGAKFLSAAVHYPGDEPWEILTNKKRTYIGMPFGTVLTLPATGSEMNSGAVITRKETKEKLGMGGPGLFPQFSILDPQVVQSIPQKQIANGLADAFTHVLEQYLTYPTGAILQDRFSESILKTIVDVAPKILKDPTDYLAASNYMWSCTMALNGLIYLGVPTDWTTHAIGHELTALFGIDHARTLAIIGPNLYNYCFEVKKDKLAQLSERIWNISEGSTDEKARIGIQNIIKFFQSLGIKTSLSEYTNEYEGTAEKIRQRFLDRGWTGLGEHKNITPNDVRKIVTMSY